MKLELFDRIIDVFSISPRTLDIQEYWSNIDKTIMFSEKYKYSGLLLFTGHDTYFDPWIVANIVMSKSTQLSPLIAVNPIYMHPFTVAKNINSLSYLYNRKVYINCVTGTSKNDLLAFNDKLNHDERYHRLVEYFLLVRKILDSSSPVSHSSKYYLVNELQLRPKIANNLSPVFFLAGSSVAAQESSVKLDATWMNVAYPVLDRESKVMKPQSNKGVYLGIITRETEMEALEVAKKLFAYDEDDFDVLAYSMNNTDSEWKHNLFKLSSEVATDFKKGGFQLLPFKSFKADCPYIIGSYQQVEEYLTSYILDGIASIIIDTFASEEEYFHINKVFENIKNNQK